MPNSMTIDNFLKHYVYYIAKKYLSIVYSNLLYKLGNYFLDKK